MHDWLVTWRGGEKCLESLLKLYPDAEIFTLFSTPEILTKYLSTFQVHSSILNKIPGVSKFYRFLLPLYPLAVWSLSSKLSRVNQENPFDLVISISHCVAKNVKSPKGVKHICYCLTPVRYIWDQYENYFKGKWYEPIVRVMRKAFQRWDIKASKDVDAFVSISNFVSQRILNYYGSKSVVIYPPVSLNRFLDSTDNLSGEFYLMVNALVPYKRVDIVVRAFNEMPDKTLLVVGTGPESDYLKSLAGKNIRFLGNVGDSELEAIYKRCKALIYPALEDFGIAPVEAQASGKPVICLKEGGCGETAIFEGEKVTALELNKVSTLDVMDAVKKFESFVQKGYFWPQNCRESAIRFSEDAFIDRFKKYA